MKPPIFIMGLPRSGTTLVAKILGSHSQIFMPGETHFFHDIYSRCKTLGDPSCPKAIESIIQSLNKLYATYNEPQDQKRVERIFSNLLILENFKKNCRTYCDVFTFFMNAQMLEEQKARWGNHAPKDIFHIQEILSFFPDAKIIICVRDVRDFLVSYKYKWRTTSDEHIDRIKKL